MESKQLMIGDWVSYLDGIYKTKAVIGFGDIVMLEWNPEHWTDKLHETKGSVCVEDITPIPLTEEILKANGWSNENSCLFWQEDVGVMNYNGSFRLCRINNVELHYVHELQHALRICGLNELSDNFKLKE